MIPQVGRRMEGGNCSKPGAGGSDCFPGCGLGRLQVCSSHKAAVTGRGRETSSTQLTGSGPRPGLAHRSQIGRAPCSSFQTSL